MAGVVKPLGFVERQPAELARRFAPQARKNAPEGRGVLVAACGMRKSLRNRNESEPSSVRATELQ